MAAESLASPNESSTLESQSAPGLSRTEAAATLADLWTKRIAEEFDARRQELESKSLTLSGKTIHWDEKSYGDEPAGGHSLWISMHGGGGTAAAINDGQYRNQIRLYSPAEGIWVVPRAPTDAWNMWHEAHIDPMFERIIEDQIVVHHINPNKVYILGYSAGGDGVYQLAPRMADRFAAASMMAGHPNEASPLGLRNLPFAIFVGGADAAYNRNKVAREWGALLDKLKSDDPDGYPHEVHIYEGLSHWMNRKDAEALPWMAGQTRDPWPKKVVWHQDDVTHTRFYWLAVRASDAAGGQTISSQVERQDIRITADGLHRVVLRLSDALVNLDQPLTVTVNGRELHRGIVPRSRHAIEASLQERSDPGTAASALLELNW